jgi:hypothetical protein
MAVSSAGHRAKSDCSGKAQKQLYSKLQTRPLVREGATTSQSRNCLKEISRRKTNLSRVPDGRLTPGQTGRLTVGRKLTSTSTSDTGVIERGACISVSLTHLAVQCVKLAGLRMSLEPTHSEGQKRC